MSIPYTYTIVKVDETARCMEVVYRSPNRQEMRVSARIPFKGESLDAVVDQFAPTGFWYTQEAELEIPQVGATGGLIAGETMQVASADLMAGVTSIEEVRRRKLVDIANWRYAKEVGGVMVGSAMVRTDRESQAQITGAYTTLKNGLIASVNWKAADGSWVPLTLAEIEPIAAAVAQHVQACFNAEMALTEQVDQALAGVTSVEEAIAAVQSVVLP